MSKYRVDIKEQAQHDLQRLLHNEPKAYQKALALIGELYEHPLTGTGHLTLLIIRLFMTREDVM